MAHKYTAFLSYKAYPKQHYLKEWRERKGWSQDELAQRLGCDRTKISRMETGTYGISIDMQLALFHVLDILPHQFWWPPDTEWADPELWGADATTRREAIDLLRDFIAQKRDKLSTES